MSLDVKNQNSFMRDLLKDIISTEGFDDDATTISIESGSEFGDGFMGENSAVDIISDDKVLKLFVKIAPTKEKLRDFFIMKESFNREINFYEMICPNFLKFQTARHAKNPFQCIPKCYATFNENYKKILVLENLKAQGFVMFDEITFVFERLAQFHAVSFAMKDQEKQLYEKLSSNLIYIFGIGFKEFCIDRALAKNCEEIRQFFNSPDERHIFDSIQNMSEDLMDILLEAPKYADEYSVIIHGDPWCNNMMFKYQGDSSCLDMRLIDWQNQSVNSPVVDLAFFFYSSASEEVLDNFHYYIEAYHSNLSRNIRELGSDPDVVYPFSVFERHWKQYSKYGLIMAILIIRLTLLERGEMPTLAELIASGKTLGDAYVLKLRNHDLYKERVKNVVKHFVKNKLL